MAVILAPEESNFEEKISIKVEGLKPNKKITVAAMMDRNMTPLVSFANYEANYEGILDLSKATALPGGTYTGCEQMGLFWSLETVNPLDLALRALCGPELDYLAFNIRVIDGHHYSKSELLASFDKATLAQVTIKRMFITGGITRTIVKYNTFRGILFLPEGEGPFPAVIDIVAFASGACSFRGGVFARNGFACLHVIYQGCDGLPRAVKSIDYDYFVEAYNFLVEHPMISKDNIAFYGCCAGGTQSLAIARCLPNVKAVVAVQSTPFAYDWDYNLKLDSNENGGEKVSATIIGTPNNLENVEVDGETFSRFIYTFKNGDWRNHSLEVGEIQASILFIYGKEDAVVKPDEMIPMLREQLERKNKQNFEIVVYEKAGHWLQPPYFWGSRTPYAEFFSGWPLLFGGNQADHAKAQEEMWEKSLDFLRHHLVTCH